MKPRSEALAAILKTAEDRLAALNQFAESAKVSAATINDSQTQIAAALAEAQAKAAEVTSAATQAVAAGTKITDLQTVIATKSDHIQDAQVHADKVRADLDRALTEATLQATEAEGLKSRAQSAVDTATAALADVRTTKGAVETDATTVSEARKAAEESAASVKSLADKSATVEERIANYEKRLAELDTQSGDRLKTIEALLRGATSAGLAHSWDARRQTFLKPQNRWQWIFVISLLAIVGVAISGLAHVYKLDKIPTFEELARLWLARLPVAGALLWLALHASRESALAKRLEEDYGFKSTVASSFEGFRKQMSEIGELPLDSPLAKLCENTLSTIAAPPGRIYDKHRLTVSPIDELKDATKTVTEAVKPMADAARALKTPL